MNTFIFIPVLFICSAMQCEFQQALTHLDTMEECAITVESQRIRVITAARLTGQEVLVESTCVTVRIPTII
jgi:hypothetical protein